MRVWIALQTTALQSPWMRLMLFPDPLSQPSFVESRSEINLIAIYTFLLLQYAARRRCTYLSLQDREWEGTPVVTFGFSTRFQHLKQYIYVFRPHSPMELPVRNLQVLFRIF
mgnify:CR=1 FL=1